MSNVQTTVDVVAGAVEEIVDDALERQGESTPFTLENLIEFGDIEEMFNGSLKALAADCKARPLISKPRTLTMKVILKPSDDDIETVEVAVDVQAKAPPQRVPRTRMKVAASDGQLTFWADEVPEFDDEDE